MEIVQNFFQDTPDEPEQPTTEYEKFVPVNDLVLVTPYNEDNSKIGSIYVADRFQQKSNRGIVVDKGASVKLDLSVGDRVTFRLGSNEILKIDNKDHLLLNENDLIGVERVK